MPDDQESSSNVKRFLELLREPERMLIILKQELYDGSWDEMEADLKARLSGSPYIFKLASRIEDDLARIEKLRAFEASAGVDLSQFVKLESEE